MPVRLLFVCTGNTCRSPLAAALARQELGALGVEAAVESAGLQAVAGQPVSAPAAAAARGAGLDVSAHRAQPLTRTAVLAAALVLVMDESQRRGVTEMAPEARLRVHLLRDYATHGAARGAVADPFGGDVATYGRTLEELRGLVSHSVMRFRSEIACVPPHPQP